eukprot:5697329-Pyramimonas_sp.AAC.1
MSDRLNATAVSAIWTQLREFADSDPKPCISVADNISAFKWVEHGLDRIITSGISDPDRIISVLTGKVIYTSTAFSGIGTPETSDNIISA